MIDNLIIGPGTWMIFGVIFVPVYGLILGWYLGSPRDAKLANMGLVYLFGLVASLWGGLYVVTLLIGLIFF